MDLSFPLKASSIHLYSLRFLHLLAVVLSIALCGFSVLLWIVLLGLGTSYYCSHRVWRDIAQWKHFKIQAGRLTLHREEGDSGVYFLLGQAAFLSPPLTVVPLKNKRGKVFYLPLFVDSAQDNDLRLLRQFLTVRPRVKKRPWQII